MLRIESASNHIASIPGGSEAFTLAEPWSPLSPRLVGDLVELTSLSHDREASETPTAWGSIFGGVLVGTQIGTPIGNASSDAPEPGENSPIEDPMTTRGARRSRIPRDLRI
ncbi:MAG: hypothetical protein U0527_04280 [Candidatus Eisenbacteria bacterium]